MVKVSQQGLIRHNSLFSALYLNETMWLYSYQRVAMWSNKLDLDKDSTSRSSRVADVEGPQDQWSPKGQGLLRKEGPPTYAILLRNLVLSRFTRFLKGFHRALNESHPAFNF